MYQTKKYRGLTLVEALMLVVIMSIVAVAAGVGLQAVAKVPSITNDTMTVNATLVSVVEQTRANLSRNWPSTTWGGSNYAFIAGGTSYTPTVAQNLGTGYSTPISGASPVPLTINNKSYQLTLTLATADPGTGSAQADYLQVTARIVPVISGVANNNSPQILVTYVAQP